MSILIKGLNMPKTTLECSTKINPEERRCNYTGKVFEETLSLLIERRCADCPLVEIPKLRGNLISSGRLERKIIIEFCKGCQSNACNNGTGCSIDKVLDIIEEFPVAIKSEE